MEIRLSNQYYHLQRDMMAWCKENVGLGGWKQSPTLLFPNQDQWVWTIESGFGTTFFTFVNEADGTKFREVWL